MIIPTVGISWTDFDGTKHSVRRRAIHAYPTAERIVLSEAKAQGWTRPRWWQWWRWGDDDPYLQSSLYFNGWKVPARIEWDGLPPIVEDPNDPPCEPLDWYGWGGTREKPGFGSPDVITPAGLAAARAARDDNANQAEAKHQLR